MHQRASIHDAMMTLTGKRHMTSEQHVDLSKSRQSRDQADIGKLLEWLDLNDPFTTDSTELRSITSGLTAMPEDNLNCYDAESVGARLQKSLDGCIFKDA